MPKLTSIKLIIPAAMIALMLTGCASNTSKNVAFNNDPYMKYNRKIYRFNIDLSNALVKPVVKGYDFIIPKPIRTGAHNFYGNVAMVPTIANDALQANFRYMFRDMARFIINSTLGLFGTVDVASDIGLTPRVQSFGLTMAKWGIRKSPYVMLPFFGPSTTRGSFGLVPDYFMSPITYIKPDKAYWVVWGSQLIQNASDVLPRQELLTETALDPYIAVRNAYMQNRKFLIKKIVNETPDHEDNTDHHASGSNINQAALEDNLQLA